MLTKRILALLVSVSVIFTPIYGQSVKELKKKEKQTKEQLATTKKMLDETRKTKKSTTNQITLLNQSIKQNTELIGVLNDEISALDRNIDTLHMEKKVLSARLTKQKESYANNVAKSELMRRHFSPIMYFLSAENFTQALRRFRYMREMAQYRKQQIAEIKSLNDQLIKKELELEENKQSKEQVMSVKTRESEQLSRQKAQKNRLLTDLSKKEKDLKKQQSNLQKKADQLNAQIQKKIAEEIKRQQEEEKRKAEAKRKAEQQKKTTTTTGGTTTSKPATTTSKPPVYQMSKEEQLVAGNFEKNKGRLPMPVEKGFISGHFGNQPHPVLKNVMQNNKGIYIQTPAGSYARSVFDGVVTQVFVVSGANTSVIIKHGNYRTVYSNLSTVSVKVGDKVTTKQRIGKIYTDTSENKTELYFMVYKDSAIQNPESWIAR